MNAQDGVVAGRMFARTRSMSSFLVIFELGSSFR
jgi:hypothetical protein